jgi:beta-glucoside operon transcriptional antiterminator
MKIIKIINNNAIYTKEKGGTELILMGSGIGWNTRVGNTVDSQKIQKSFVLKNQSYTKIQNFLNRVNADALDIAEDIFNKAQEVFGKSLDDQMILALAVLGSGDKGQKASGKMGH